MKDLVWEGVCPRCRTALRVMLEARIFLMVDSRVPLAPEQPPEASGDPEDLTEAEGLPGAPRAPDGGPLPIDCDYQEDAILDPPPR